MYHIVYLFTSTARSVDDFSYDLENWMKKLPDSIRDNVPIINLAIPGTHNSGKLMTELLYQSGFFKEPLT